MNYPDFWDISYLTTNSQCSGGFGCFYYNLNFISHGIMHSVVLLVIFLIILFNFVEDGNELTKSMIATLFLLVILGIISILYELINTDHLITIIVLFALAIAFKIGKSDSP